MRHFPVFLLSAIAGIVTLSLPAQAFASGGGGHGGQWPVIFFFIGVMLFVGISAGAAMRRIGQPAVLGQLLAGIGVGALGLLGPFDIVQEMRHEAFIIGLAELGVVLLLFATGLESNVKEMLSAGPSAAKVAIVGVALPFVGGYYASLMLMPEMTWHVHVFLGATLTATSVGITAAVFKSLDFLKSDESKIVIGAAVIDDVLGLIILAVVVGVVQTGSVDPAGIALISGKAIGFLVGAVVLGMLLAKPLGRLFSRIHTGHGMKNAIIVLFCLSFSFMAAHLAGLAMIVGAFAAGLILDAVVFRDFEHPEVAKRFRAWASRIRNSAPDVADEMEEAAHHEEHADAEKYIGYLMSFLTPIFFVYTGMMVDLTAFSDPNTVIIALVITTVAFFGKFLAGFLAGSGVNRKLIGFGMVPRGEVGLIFAAIGANLTIPGTGEKVVNDQVFAVAVIMVTLTTLVTPPILNGMIRRMKPVQTPELPKAARTVSLEP